MTMKPERFVNDARFVNGERKRTVNDESKIVNDERTINARWTHAERTVVREPKNGKVERFRDCNIHLEYERLWAGHTTTI